MINLLPVLGIFPAIVMHNLIKLSTNNPQLSTGFGRYSWITLLTVICVFGSSRSIHYAVNVWPQGGDVPFVWQTALTAMGQQLRTADNPLPTTIVGWSPESMDAPTMTLAMSGVSAELRHTTPPTVILPAGSGDQFALALPATPPLNMPSLLQSVLEDRAISAETHPAFNQFTFDISRQPLAPQHPIPTKFADELTLLGYTTGDCDTANCQLLTFWRVEEPSQGDRHIFVHALDEDGQLVAQSDGLDAPTQFWQTGDLIIRQHDLSAETPMATITAGIYTPTPPYTRLQTSTNRDHALLITFSIE